MKFGKTLVVLSLTLASGLAGANDKKLVEYRDNGMEILGGHMGSIVAIVKGEVPYASELAYHADALAAAAPTVLTMFEIEAMSDDSDALPKIWQQWADFEKAARKLETASADLAAAVASGERGAIGAALGEVGKSCKGCHDEFVED
ncbi:MAG: cytochrome c [Porticoccaceae bacterium]